MMVGFVEVCGHDSVGFVGYVIEVICKSGLDGVASLSDIYESTCFALYGVDKVMASTIDVDFCVPASVVKQRQNAARFV